MLITNFINVIRTNGMSSLMLNAKFDWRLKRTDHNYVPKGRRGRFLIMMSYSQLRHLLVHVHAVSISQYLHTFDRINVKKPNKVRNFRVLVKWAKHFRQFSCRVVLTTYVRLCVYSTKIHMNPVCNFSHICKRIIQNPRGVKTQQRYRDWVIAL